MGISLKSVKKGYLAPTILVTSGLGMFLVWLRQSNYGADISPDSVLYISLAESLARGEGFISWDGSVSVTNLFPLTLATVISLGVIDKFSAAEYLNIVVYGLSIFVLMIWIYSKIKSRFIVLYMGTVCAISSLLGNGHARVLIEPLLGLFIITSIFALDRFLASNTRNKGYWIILTAVSGTLSFLAHPIGIYVIISTLIILAINRTFVIAKMKYTVIYLTVTMSTVGVYLLLNFVRVGHFFSTRYNLPFSHLSSIDFLTSGLAKWIFGDIGFDYLETVSENFDINNILARIVIFAILVAFLIFFWLRLQGGKGLVEFREIATPVAFILVYIFVLYISLAISGRAGPIRERYLLPIYMPYLLIFAVVLDQFLSKIRHKIYMIFIVGSMSLWLISDAITNYNDIKEWQDYGFGYLSRDWTDSETINYFNSNPVAGFIYSNQIRSIYVNSRIPDKDGMYLRRLLTTLPENDAILWTTDRTQNVNLQNVDMHVVWFNNGKVHNIQFHYDLMALIASQNLEVVVVLEDGIVLRRNKEFLQYFEDLETTILGAILKDARLLSSNTMFDLYFDDKRIIYVSTLCANTDTESRLFLHIYPENHADRRNRGLDFNNYDFSFSREGFFWGKNCAVIRNLPDYDIEKVRTGQFSANEGELWVEEFRSELLYQQRIS